MKKRMQLNFMAIAMISMIAVLLLTTVVFYNLFQNEVIENLHTCADMLGEDLVNYKDTDRIISQKKVDNIRVTLIDKDGVVLADSDVNADVLGNHKERPEVKEAIEKGSGKSIRTSNTLSHASYYYAIRLSNGNILRLAKESQSFFSFLIRVSPFIGGIAILLFVVSIFLSRLFAKSIVKPIEMLAKNMDREELATGYKELTPFLNTIQKQHRDIVKNSNMRQEFTANVSHELKTPLTSISGYSELIAGGMAKGEDVVRFAGEIQKNSSRLLTLINDILQLSELDTRNFNDDFAWVDFADTVRNCGDLLALAAKKRNVTLHLETVPEVVMIHGVTKMLEELAYNLIDNGIRYNKEGGQVVVCLAETENTVIFCVKDTGIGISKENQERIFERFYRVDKGRSRETGGTGLGLAIVKKLVEQMEGTIHFVSEPGKGTRFTLVIPFLPDDSIEMQTEQTQSTGAVKGIENDKILLVEDYEINMEIARFVLENEGAQVQEAWNGKEAVDLFAASEPGGYDVILMDLMMPVMGGLEAAQCIRKLEREDAKTVPIIAMTANAFADDEERSLAAGMDAHISKPLDAEKLIQVISDICKKRKEHAKGDADI